MNLQEALVNANMATEEQIVKAKENDATESEYMAVLSDGFYTWVEHFKNEKSAREFYEEKEDTWERIDMFKVESVQF